jgi:hypothetical protein
MKTAWPTTNADLRTSVYSDLSTDPFQDRLGTVARSPFRTATPVRNRANWWHAVLLGEFRAPFLNGAQRSVNRKVQGSNPWSGAKIEFKSDVRPGDLSAGTPVLHPLYTNCGTPR